MWLHNVIHTRASILSHCTCRWLLQGVSIAYDVWGCRDGCHKFGVGHPARWPLLSNAWALIIHHIFTFIAAYVYFSTPINVRTVIVSFINNWNFQELLKDLSCASEAANPSLQSQSTTTPPCLNFPCQKEVPISHHWAHFLTQFSCSVTSFQNFIINFFLLRQSFSYTPQNSTSG